MAKKSWQSKSAPADMSLDELQDAKEDLQTRFAVLQTEYNWVQAAMSQVDAEISTRFHITVPSAGGPSLPAYPAEAVADATFANGTSNAQ